MGEVGIDIRAKGGWIGGGRERISAPPIRNGQARLRPAFDAHAAAVPRTAKIAQNPGLVSGQRLAIQAFGKIRDGLIVDLIRSLPFAEA
jgi:hypothetical protein